MPKQNENPKSVKDLAKWLKENLYLISDDGVNRLSRVLARQLVKGNKRGEEVFYIDVPKKANDDWCDTSAIELYARLQADATSLSGMQKYALYAYTSGDNENHISRFVIRIQGTSDDDDEDPLDSEGPDKAGINSQLMRHSEAQQKINVTLSMSTYSALQSIVNRQSAMIEKLLEARIESIDLVENLIHRKHEREIELIQTETKAKAVKDIATKLGLFIPALANKISGQNLFPVQANAVMMMVKGLVSSIVSDEVKLKKVMDLLSAEQQVVFMNVVEEVSKSVDEAGLPVEGTNGTVAPHAKG